MKRVSAIFAVSLLLGCASMRVTSVMSFVGKDARQTQIKYGPPETVYDVPDGTRAFGYSWTGGARPAFRQTEAPTLEALGGNAYYAEKKLESGMQDAKNPYCRVTYFAKWDASAKAWIVIDLTYYHDGECEAF